MSLQSFMVFLFVICLVYTSSAIGGNEIKKKWFQHCEVQMPDHLDGYEWVWNTFPAYCSPERLRVTIAYKDIKCISDTKDRVDYCNLTKLAYKLPNRSNDLTYRCNVYNATSGTFFYYGNVWPDYASC
jgi:hypothetical protein